MMEVEEKDERKTDATDVSFSELKKLSLNVTWKLISVYEHWFVG